MLKVLKSYLPFLLWLLLAAFALAPSIARTSSDDAESVDTKLRLADSLLREHRWAEAARMKLPAAGSPAWTARRQDECDLLFARGLAAARAGYPAMAWHSIERLRGLRAEFSAAGELRLAHRADRHLAALAKVGVPPED
jgi:hypothetical protein